MGKEFNARKEVGKGQWPVEKRKGRPTLFQKWIRYVYVFASALAAGRISSTPAAICYLSR